MIMVFRPGPITAKAGNPMISGIRMAVELVEKAIELDPGFVRAYLGLSCIHSWMYFAGIDRTNERLAQSKAALDKALELEPGLPEAKEALAWYYYRGFLDYDRALEILESVQKARPNIAPDLLGYIQRRQGKWEESIASLERSFRLDPRDGELAYSIGDIYQTAAVPGGRGLARPGPVDRPRGL